MSEFADIPTVAHAIQLAVAPVFLLTGIAGLLGVQTSRLGRIIDRYRLLNRLEPQEAQQFWKERQMLSRRARWILRAISFCTVAALLVCTSIVALFIGVDFVLDVSSVVSLLFVAAMFSLIFGLLCFLREVALATVIIENCGL